MNYNTEYTFKAGNFYFKVHADEDKEAVHKARRALEESFAEDSIDHLDIPLTAGAYLGRLYIEPEEITVQNICIREPLPETDQDIPF